MKTIEQQENASIASSSQSDSRVCRSCLIFAGLVAVACLLAFRELADWLKLSLHDDRFSHLWLIPLISAGIVFEARRTVFRRIRWTWDGVYWVAAGSILAGLSFLPSNWQPANVLSLFLLGFVVLLSGLFRMSFGPDAWRAVRFPLAFLIFMVPVPVFLLSGITYALQVGSAAVTEAIYTVLRVPYLRDGLTFDLTGLSIEIAEQCSGIRSSTALVLLTILSAQYALRSRWRKLILVISVIPVVIFKNGLRIATLSLLAVHVDQRFITGAPHHRGGFVFFGLMWLVMIALCLVLRKGEHKNAARSLDIESSSSGQSAASVC
jgi:exosortase